MVILIRILMSKLITVSAKVSEELKRKADELGINISALVRRALEDEIKRIELQSVIKNLKDEVKKAPELPEGTIVRIIRDMREGHKVVK
ncbi:MAG: type II toxin-antitoxin system CcdA family antitoxin [Nitrososphaerales archaeon]